jgi:tetratricopeptide (TPR) repeat protein
MRIIVILIIIVGSAVAVFTIFLAKSIFSPKKISGLANLVKQKKTTAAMRLAKQIIAKEPRNSDAHYLLGCAYLEDNKSELALMEFKTVNQISQFGRYCPEIPFRQMIAELYAKYNQAEEALKEYLLLIKKNPEDAKNYFHSAVLFEERNRSDKALFYYRKSLEINPTQGEAHYRLGLLMYNNKQKGEAKTEIELALRYSPDNYKAAFYLGKIYKEKHDYTAALPAFEKAQKDPEYKIKSLVERGGCFMSLNNTERAIAELERAVKLSGAETSAEAIFGRYFLAMCYEKIRKIERAIEQWEFIYSKKRTFKDVAEKLSQYQDLRTDDRMKDYLTSAIDEYLDICKSITTIMGLTVQDVTGIPNGCQVIGVDSQSNWRNARKVPMLLWFLRVGELIDVSTIRDFHEEMKKLSVTRGSIMTSSSFSRGAREFAESRPVELLNRDTLQDLLAKITG